MPQKNLEEVLRKLGEYDLSEVEEVLSYARRRSIESKVKRLPVTTKALITNTLLLPFILVSGAFAWQGHWVYLVAFSVITYCLAYLVAVFLDRPHRRGRRFTRGPRWVK